MVVRDLDETEKLAKVIRGEETTDFFYQHFGDRCSTDFDPKVHLERIGVVNQTTMLASETQAIASLLRQVIIDRYGAQNVNAHFADTRDTLCYATKENQDAALSLIGFGNIQGRKEIRIRHLDVRTRSLTETESWLPTQNGSPTDIILTAGASCPDALLDQVLQKIVSWFPESRSIDYVLAPFQSGT